METIHRFSLRLGPICLATAPIFLNSRIISLNPGLPNRDPVFNTHFTIRKSSAQPLLPSPKPVGFWVSEERRRRASACPI
ncbi:hypothetical protein EV2_025897 [Malus domestica]